VVAAVAAEPRASSATATLPFRVVAAGGGKELLPAGIAAEVGHFAIAFSVESAGLIHVHAADRVFALGFGFAHGSIPLFGCSFRAVALPALRSRLRRAAYFLAFLEIKTTTRTTASAPNTVQSHIPWPDHPPIQPPAWSIIKPLPFDLILHGKCPCWLFLSLPSVGRTLKHSLGLKQGTDNPNAILGQSGSRDFLRVAGSYLVGERKPLANSYLFVYNGLSSLILPIVTTLILSLID
jgi:hypothetical protein